MAYRLTGFREAFIEVFEGDCTEWWKELGLKRSYEMLGRLWRCTDQVPRYTRNAVVDWLGDVIDNKTHDELCEGCTYAQLVRRLKPELEKMERTGYI